MKSAALFVFVFAIACCPARHLVKPELVAVPGGTFFQGDFVEGTDTDATPLMKKSVKPFRMMKYEVSFAQFDTVASYMKWEKPERDTLESPAHAVTFVDWSEAKRFCECMGMRLPTETEWEYAARSGGKKEAIAGNVAGGQARLFASFESDPLETRNRIGMKRPNGLGLYDMSGNVNEWTGTYIPLYKKPRKTADFKKTDVRIVRGGSFLDPLPTYNPDGFALSIGMFTFRRQGALWYSKNSDIGFRCVKPYLFPFLH